MKQYRPRVGQVSVLAEDVNAMQEAVLSNIRDRLGAFIKKTGIKANHDEEFSFSWSYSGGDDFLVRLSNVGTVVFSGMTVVSGGGAIETVVTIPWGQTRNLFITRGRVYGNDQEGNFMPGHPVDESGALPPYGYNVEETDSLELIGLLTSAAPPKGSILIGKVTRVSATPDLVFQDERSSSALSINDIGFTVLAENQVENLKVSSTYLRSYLETEAFQGAGVNTKSPKTNAAVNKAYFVITWDSAKDVFCYELRLRTVDSNGRQIGQPEHYWIPEENHGSVETIVEVAEGVLYEVAVRILSNSPYKTPGPWVSVNRIGGATALMSDDVEYAPIGGMDIMPAPSVTANVIQGSVGGRTPFTVEIDVAAAPDTPHPYMVQIFQSENLPSDVPVGELVYEGSPGPVRVVQMPGESFYYSARTVGPAGVSSSLTVVDQEFAAPSIMPDPSMPEELVVTLPIHTSFLHDDMIPFYVFHFMPPAGNVRLRSMHFLGAGTWIESAGPQNDLKVQIGVSPPGFEMQSYARGKRILCPANITLADVPVANTAPDTGPGYMAVTGSRVISSPVVWPSNQEVYLVLSAYNWTAASTPGIHVYGDLTLIFDYSGVMEVEE